MLCSITNVLIDKQTVEQVAVEQKHTCLGVFNKQVQELNLLYPQTAFWQILLSQGISSSAVLASAILLPGFEERSE